MGKPPYSRRERKAMRKTHLDSAVALGGYYGKSIKDLDGIMLIQIQLKYLTTRSRIDSSTRSKLFAALNSIKGCDRLAILERHGLRDAYEANNPGKLPNARGDYTRALRTLGGTIVKGRAYTMLVQREIVEGFE